MKERDGAEQTSKNDKKPSKEGAKSKALRPSAAQIAQMKAIAEQRRLELSDSESDGFDDENEGGATPREPECRAPAGAKRPTRSLEKQAARNQRRLAAKAAVGKAPEPTLAPTAAPTNTKRAVEAGGSSKGTLDEGVTSKLNPASQGLNHCKKLKRKHAGARILAGGTPVRHAQHAELLRKGH